MPKLNSATTYINHLNMLSIATPAQDTLKRISLTGRKARSQWSQSEHDADIKMFRPMEAHREHAVAKSESQSALQRAIRAEQQLNNPDNPIQEARNYVNTLRVTSEEQ